MDFLTGFGDCAESARENVEHVLVMWNVPELARGYAAIWQTRFDRAGPYGGAIESTGKKPDSLSILHRSATFGIPARPRALPLA